LQIICTTLAVGGHVLSWLMKVWYIVCVGFLATLFQFQDMREVVPFLKQLEFILVPLVQVLTSAPIRHFISAKKH